MTQMPSSGADSQQAAVPHAAAAWEHWRKIGAPQFHVAPMVDQSELPFRMLCRKHGATSAYTPMLHARLFAEGAPYRAEHLTTCAEDRPLFVQFCTNDPAVLVRAAAHVDDGSCDYVDLNFGCPQRIAKRGNYGAFLMDDLPKAESLVRALHEDIATPVSAKIRIFPELQRTLEYAKMLEAAGASLVAVHGRTREHKRSADVRADWDAIAAVKAALSVPVIGNGNVRTRADVHAMMEATGVDGVMSAESLLEDPALFDDRRLQGEPFSHLQRMGLALEYLDMLERYPVPSRMAHMHKLLGPWLQEHTDVRDKLCQRGALDAAFCREVVHDLQAAVDSVGRDYPLPKLSARQQARLEREAAIAGAKEEQKREEAAVAAIEATQATPFKSKLHAGANAAQEGTAGRLQALRAARAAKQQSGGDVAARLGQKIAALDAVAQHESDGAVDALEDEAAAHAHGGPGAPEVPEMLVQDTAASENGTLGQGSRKAGGSEADRVLDAAGHDRAAKQPRREGTAQVA